MAVDGRASHVEYARWHLCCNARTKPLDAIVDGHTFFRSSSQPVRFDISRRNFDERRSFRLVDSRITLDHVSLRDRES